MIFPWLNSNAYFPQTQRPSPLVGYLWADRRCDLDVPAKVEYVLRSFRPTCCSKNHLHSKVPENPTNMSNKKNRIHSSRLADVKLHAQADNCSGQRSLINHLDCREWRAPLIAQAPFPPTTRRTHANTSHTPYAPRSRLWWWCRVPQTHLLNLPLLQQPPPEWHNEPDPLGIP